MNKKTKGFSLIELMVAMLIGLIMLLGIVSLFTNTNILQRAQSGLSVLQENGRYAIMRIKQDLEQAGHNHCASIAVPTSDLVSEWDQGFATKAWRVSNNVTAFDNGFPAATQVVYDPLTPAPLTTDSYALDTSYFIRGHECSASSCQPALNSLGADLLTSFPSMGTADGDRAQSNDVLTVRYLKGGFRLRRKHPSNAQRYNTEIAPGGYSGRTLLTDCKNSFVTNATWSGRRIDIDSVDVAQAPSLHYLADPKAYKLDEELRSVTYFVGVDEDPADSSRKYSSLYRSENGITQQLVEGVEQFDLFYLAQLNDGTVARLTADQVDGVSGSGSQECVTPPDTSFMGATKLNNGQGCLWRSIYAIEVHMLLNTVNNSATSETEPYRYSIDGLNLQTPDPILANGLARERMYRKEFTAIIPVRSYTL